MPRTVRGRWGIAAVVAAIFAAVILVSILLKPRIVTPTSTALRDEIPADQLVAVLEANRRGIGHMERFVEYADAVDDFREVHRRAPGLIAGSINLAIALLNEVGAGEEEEAKKNPGGPKPKGNFEEALELLDEVLKRDPNNLHAHYCKGVILQDQGESARAHEQFQFVVAKDPSDGHAWLRFGGTLPNPADRSRPAGPRQAKELIEIYTKALTCNPYLVGALFKLQTAYSWAGNSSKQDEILNLWRKLNPAQNVAGSGELSGPAYGEIGRYAVCIDPSGNMAEPSTPAVSPRFGPPSPLAVTLPEGDRWVLESDFTGPLAVVGRFRNRFGAAVATFDADRDGRLDLFLAAAVIGKEGIRDALLLNRGDGKFEDASTRFGLPKGRASLGVAAADFDADLHVDLFLTGVGDNRLLRNLAGKRFLDVSWSLPQNEPPAISPTARWLDLDQDGDLDLYVVNYTAVENADSAFTSSVPKGLPNSAYRYDGKPAEVANRPESNWAPLAVAPSDLPAREGLSISFKPLVAADHPFLGGNSAHTSVAWLDADADGDLDLAIGADDARLLLALNDRLGVFHVESARGDEHNRNLQFQTRGESHASERRGGMLSADLDGDGPADLVACRNDGDLEFLFGNPHRDPDGRSVPSFRVRRPSARRWSSAIATDLDLDGRCDLVGLPESPEPLSISWARGGPDRTFAFNDLALGPDAAGPKPIQGFAIADLIGDPLPDLILVKDGQGPRLAKNLGNGHHWLAIDLSGCWKASFDQMRSNVHGIGTKVSLRGAGLDVNYLHATPNAGPSQSVGPIVLGMGDSAKAELLRMRWPDNVNQCELSQPADVSITLAETNRKTGSCPVLFTWNGERFVCLGDFLGGGGLGFLVEPGVYGQPDRDEAMFVEPGQLREVDGAFRLAVVEPMDESAYIDRVRLDVVDLPPGVNAAPDERFAPGGNRPTGELLTWKSKIDFIHAADLKGLDITDRLRDRDGRYVDDFRRLAGWIGYVEDHGIVLDFGDRLANLAPGARPVLCLDGWVEYPYSSTNLAASSAGHRLEPPILERLRDDGTWEILERDPGYPAGLPRRTTLELTGKLGGPRCVLRLRTNMECYWDHAFIALRDDRADARVTTLTSPRASLGYRGYLREVPTDGHPPLIYDYDRPDPAPLASMTGPFTRYGDVAELVRDDDDHFCVVGPGDDLRLEFDARALPPLPSGWRRCFLLRSEGYCKDADLGTATGDSILPFPWRGMPAFPFGPGVKRPEDEGYREYMRKYQTRMVKP